jgi:hypothetical protein
MLLPLGAIWSVPYYVNQDGSQHLYNAYLILELLKGNPTISAFVMLNPVLVPNLTGHWILAGMLSVLSAALATKLMVSALFVGMVGSVSWLRRQVSGKDDEVTGLLLAVVLAFNWMWFLGLYNFTLGAIGFAVTLGLWWKWRDAFTWWRTALVALLLLFVYLSHVIAFGALVFALLIVCVGNPSRDSRTTTIRTLCAILPILPFLAGYLRLSAGSAPISPAWGNLVNPWSAFNWLSHLRTADPFQLMSPRALPFVDQQSRWFAIASPTPWLVIALCCLVAASFPNWRKEHPAEKRTVRLWSGLALFFCLVWLAGPDGFGTAHGWYLRERSLLIGLICFVPAFRSQGAPALRRFAQAVLLFIIAFQSAVLWAYSRYASDEARQMMSARDHIADTDSLGSIVLNREGCQFKATPRGHLSAFIAVGKDTRLWDNFELNYYLFPVVARNEQDRQWFARHEPNGLDFCNASEPSDKMIGRLDRMLQTQYDRITVLLVWGRDERVDEVVGHWYESQPFYQDENVRLFRRR